ncbi:MAG: enoyl-CoA hydratase-related protein [Sphingomonadales bacterium]
MTALNEKTDYAVEGSIAVITIDSPPVNALGFAVRSGIALGLAKAFFDPAIKAAVLICNGRTFCAGADITEFGKPMLSPVLRELGVLIENASKPVVAAIHGTALGGGLELALACHWRIAVPGAKMGLPEVKLGLLAGAGGTQRLPRLVGAPKALDMVVSGDPIGAREAFAFGLIDAVAEGDLKADAVTFALSLASRTDRLRRVRDMAVPPADPAMFDAFRANHAERLKGFEAPEASIACIEAAVSETFDCGMVTERHLFDGLMAGNQCAAQRYFFFAERDAPKVPGVAKSPIDITSVTVGLQRDDALAALIASAGVAVMRGSDAPRADIVLESASRGETPNTVAVGPAPERSPGNVRIDLLPHGGAPTLLEIGWTDDVPASTISALLALAKTLGVAPVVTRRSDVLIGNRIAARLDTEMRNCVRAGAPAQALAAAASDFGLTVPSVIPGSATPGTASFLRRLVATQINEGARLIDEGAAFRGSDIDVAAVKRGLWKVYRGGPMFHAGQLGLDAVIETLEALEKAEGTDYRPSPLLRRLQASGDTLHTFEEIHRG